MKLRNGRSALNDYTQSCTMNYYPACQRTDMLKGRMAENKGDEDLYRTPGLPTRSPKQVSENIKAGHAALMALNNKEAMSAFKRALDINPHSAEAHAGISLAYLSIKDRGKAAEMANKALRINPKSITGHFAMSRIMYEDGNYNKALEYINVAIVENALYTKSPYHFLLRADIYMKLRNEKSALKDYERACRMNVSWGCKRAQIVKQQIGEADK